MADDYTISASHHEVPTEKLGFTLQQHLPIPPAVQHKVDHLKMKTKADDETYLSEHPQIPEIVDFLSMEVLQHRPKSVLKFAAELFTKPNIREIIEKRSKIIKSKKVDTENWVLKPHKLSDWRNAPQMNLGIEEDEDSTEDVENKEGGEINVEQKSRRGSVSSKATDSSIKNVMTGSDSNESLERNQLEHVEDYMMKLYKEVKYKSEHKEMEKENETIEGNEENKYEIAPEENENEDEENENEENEDDVNY